jgi:hypothetical protein
MGKEIDPKLVFDRLFSNENSGEAQASRARRDALRRSILDFVSDDAKRLQSQLGRVDQRKLDEYLTGVREVERRIAVHVNQNAVAPPNNYPQPTGIPKDQQDFEQHIRLMCDMMVLAFQADLTRISTFVMANEGSNRPYRQIGVSEGHHDLSHHGNDAQKHAKIRQINRFHVTQLAYLLNRLKSIKEGNSSLLDNCMIVYGSGISDGNRHNHENLPVLLAGRGRGTIDTGRHVRFAQELPMCNLFLSMLDRMGVHVDYMGDSTGRLGGLQI